jgi:TRAP-type C4-dicarboxylate transport system substrate-binding protein
VNDDENSGVAQMEKEGMQVVKKVDGEAFRKAVAPAYANFSKEFGADKIAAIQAVK